MDNIMRKPELAAAIAAEIEVNQERAGEILNVILDQISKTVSRDEKVSLIGFGTFAKTERAARKGRNPQTGLEMDIAASNSVNFKAGKALKDAVNSK
jgi:DNA-binding protein HU-alpha